MKITLFSIEKANRLIRTLAPEMEELMRLRGEIQSLERRIGVLSLVLSGAADGNPDAAEARELIARRTELAAQLRYGLKVVHERGCIVKDLDRGLVDFHALMGDRLVFLCWQLGEREISHWHTLDGGFAARQPLDRSELE